MENWLDLAPYLKKDNWGKGWGIGGGKYLYTEVVKINIGLLYLNYETA